MNKRTYEYLKGHKLVFNKIEIITNEDGSKSVIFYAPLCVNERVELPWSYSPEYTDREILADWQLIERYQELYGRINECCEDDYLH